MLSIGVGVICVINVAENYDWASADVGDYVPGSWYGHPGVPWKVWRRVRKLTFE